MFSGNRAVQELILEIRVLRSQLLATSMGELSKVMMNKPFPDLRRPIAIESPRDRNLRVTFSGEQGSGPGVTRGWFSAVTKTIHELIDQAANASDAQSSGGSKVLNYQHSAGLELLVHLVSSGEGVNYVDHAGAPGGGAIFLLDSTTPITGSTFTANWANVRGGAILAVDAFHNQNAASAGQRRLVASLMRIPGRLGWLSACPCLFVQVRGPQGEGTV